MEQILLWWVPLLPRNIPFALNVQVLQFLHFKARSLELVAAGSGHLLDDQAFRNALYVIDIGQTDISDSFAKNMPYAQVVRKIPSIVAQIKNAIQVIYNGGGRRFWIHNTGPFGCLPQRLTMVEKTSENLDRYGCISSYNAAARVFNEILRQSCKQLRNEMRDATIVYVDIYAIKYDLIANSGKYGFPNPLMTCCGYGGPPYNYNIKVACGSPGYQVCNEGARFLFWDGIHYSEAANAIIASKILSTAYSTPPIAFDFFANDS